MGSCKCVISPLIWVISTVTLIITLLTYLSLPMNLHVGLPEIARASVPLQDTSLCRDSGSRNPLPLVRGSV